MSTISAAGVTTPRRRMSRAVCKLPQPCHLCQVRVKAGQRMALDFDNGLWAHQGCVVRKVNERRRVTEAVW